MNLFYKVFASQSATEYIRVTSKIIFGNTNAVKPRVFEFLDLVKGPGGGS